jgi:hypothetical protein
MADARTVQLFNLDTMSGVFPGTRTQVFQRVQLRPLTNVEQTRLWAQLLWYDHPPACVVMIPHSNGVTTGNNILLRIENPLEGEAIRFNQQLQQALLAAGYQLICCGSCLHWHSAAIHNVDGLPLGDCGLRRQSQVGEEAPEKRQDGFAKDLPEQLTIQSNLALACSQWQTQTASTNRPDSQTNSLPVTPLPKVAEVSESKLKFWPRLHLKRQRLVQRWLALWRGDQQRKARQHNWRDRLLERSGVGAGVEPCFACQGRIANLAALVVESAEGDKQTFSVWRCRNCYTLYLNDWIDRWERLESLETEERIYRIAPVEAGELFHLISNVEGGEHPRLRKARNRQRDWLLNYFADHAPLSHQIRQGR